MGVSQYEIDPTYTGLVGAILEHPAEDTPRLALADWLEDFDQPRAELIRGQVQHGDKFAARAGDLLDEHAHRWLGDEAVPFNFGPKLKTHKIASNVLVPKELLTDSQFDDALTVSPTLFPAPSILQQYR